MEEITYKVNLPAELAQGSQVENILNSVVSYTDMHGRNRQQKITLAEMPGSSRLASCSTAKEREMSMLIMKLASKLKKADPKNDYPAKAVDYLKRNGFGSPLRQP